MMSLVTSASVCRTGAAMTDAGWLVRTSSDRRLRGSALGIPLRRGRDFGEGELIGPVGAAAMTRLLTTFLFEIRPNDGITYASVVALLGVMSTLAIYLPARRSSRA